MMKSWISAVAIASAFALSGCGAGVSDEDRYLQTVREHQSLELATNSDESIVALGNTLCEKIEEQGARYVVGIAAENPDVMDPKDFGVIFGSAVKHLCPEHEQEVENLIKSVDNGTLL